MPLLSERSSTFPPFDLCAVGSSIMILLAFALSKFSTVVMATSFTTISARIPRPFLNHSKACYEKPMPHLTSSTMSTLKLNSDHIDYIASTTTVNPVASTTDPSSSQYTGDMTYYDVSVGLGSCGWQGSNSQDLVALAADVMDNGANPNDNPKCNMTINIYYNGETHSAIVCDTCPTCSGGSIDVTQELFMKVAPNGNGRVHGVSWSFAK